MILDRVAIRAMGLRASTALVKSTKAPAGALARVEGYNIGGQPLYPDFSGEAAIELAYLKNVYTYKCIDTIANTIAGWPFRAGDSITNNFRLTHPLAQLLGPAGGSPNPNWSAHTLWRYSIAQYLLLGKFAWALEKDSTGKVIGLWPLQSQHLFPVPASSGSNFFEKFRYGVMGQHGYKEFRNDEIVYVYRPSLKDFRQPESPVQMASININISKMLDQFDYSFLKNGGVPAHLIITPPWATDEDRDNFQMQFIADFSGAANVGKAMFAEREMQPGETPGGSNFDTVDVKTIGTNQRDAQINLLRDAEIQAICLAWGVPLSIMGDASHRTFSNAIDERTNYIQHTCLPKAREIQDGINLSLGLLLDESGQTVGWFDTSGVPELKPAPLFANDGDALTLLQADVVTKDEFRASKGLPPSKDVGLDEKMKEPPAPVAPLAIEPGKPTSAPAVKDAGAKGSAGPSAPKAHTRAIGDAFSDSVFVAGPDACDECQALDGALDPDFGAWDRLHPNCKCSVVSTKRHAGHSEHQHIVSGHPTKKTLETHLTAALRKSLEGIADSISEQSRGKRARRGEPVELDIEYWYNTIAETVRNHLSQDTVSVEQVEEALVDLYAGNTTVDSLIAKWERHERI